jgi:hypothetical protein
MSQSFQNRAQHLRIFFALLHRDLKMFKQTFRSRFIDSICVLIVEVLLFSNLLPYFGMPREFIAPLYLGAVVGFMFFLGFSQASLLVFDQQYDHFIDYHLTLPLPKRWLFAKYISFFMLESLTITLPLISLGIILLGTNFPMTNPNVWLFGFMYILMILFFTVFFTGTSFYYDADFFHDHIWPRRLSPLFNLSATFFTWKGIYLISPVIAYVLLANPITYLAEGLRATLLNQDDYLSIYLCFGVIAACMPPLFFLLAHGIKKRLDPV